MPENLKQLEKEPTGRIWLKQLPQLITEVCKQWQLELDQPYEDSNISYVASAYRNNQSVVLKIQWPHEECKYGD
jgi:hypothetical protein